MSKNYIYKKEFFGEWLRKSKVKRADVRHLLGSSNEERIQVWALEKPLPPTKRGDKDGEERAMLPLKHILKLCNHYDLSLSDFIENADEPQVKKRRGQGSDDSQEVRDMRLELLEARADHLQQMASQQEQARCREDAIRQEYEQKIAELKRLMQTTIDAQHETILSLREQIERTKKEGDHHPYKIAAD